MSAHEHPGRPASWEPAGHGKDSPPPAATTVIVTERCGRLDHHEPHTVGTAIRVGLDIAVVCPGSPR